MAIPRQWAAVLSELVLERVAPALVEVVAEAVLVCFPAEQGSLATRLLAAVSSVLPPQLALVFPWWVPQA